MCPFIHCTASHGLSAMRVRPTSIACVAWRGVRRVCAQGALPVQYKGADGAVRLGACAVSGASAPEDREVAAAGLRAGACTWFASAALLVIKCDCSICLSWFFGGR